MRSSDPDRIRAARWRFAAGGLVVIAVVVCVITLIPTPVDQGRAALVDEVLRHLHDLGVPQRFGYAALEFSANILMFLPVGWFVGLLLPLRRVWIGGAIATLFSVLVEALQHLVLPERFASAFDVLANSLGGWIGVGLIALTRIAVREGVRARDRRLLAATRADLGSVGESMCTQAPAPSAAETGAPAPLVTARGR